MRVQDVDEAFLYIYPFKKAISPTYEDGAFITCTLWRDEDVRYTFDSKIMRHDDIHAKWRLNHNTEKMERTQDRGYFRLSFPQSVTLGILNASIDEDTNNIKKRQSITKLRGKIMNTSNISGGRTLIRTQFISTSEDKCDIITRYLLQKQ